MGDFKITKVIEHDTNGNSKTVLYIVPIQQFTVSSAFSPRVDIYITAKIEMKEMQTVIFDIIFRLQIPFDRLQNLKPFEYYKSKFVLAGYEDLKFTYFVNKINTSPPNDIEVHIENSFDDVKIHGKKGDFKRVFSSSANIDLRLSFCFNPDKYRISVIQESFLPESVIDGFESLQIASTDKGTVRKIFPRNCESKLYKIGSNALFADVLFKFRDGTTVFSHRNILAEVSPVILLQIFKNATELPVQIDIEDSDAETIQSSLEFCYGNPDGIKGKEVKIKQDILLLKEETHAKTEMKEMQTVIFDIIFRLQIPFDRLQNLKPFEYYKSKFVLAGYEDLKFTYFVKKINTSSTNDIEVHIENSFDDVEIHGKNGDFKRVFSSSENIDLRLSFCFNPDKYRISVIQESFVPESVIDGFESLQIASTEESRPESVISSEIFPRNCESKLYKIGSNAVFTDVLFKFRDGTTVYSHRNILAEVSPVILLQIFKNATELPVPIDIEDSDAETIQSSLEFCYGNSNAIKGKEIKDACRSYFVESVDPSNVCEFIQIAYAKNFEELKQKCLKFLFENRTKIDASKIAELPKNIVIDTLCFKI